MSKRKTQQDLLIEHKPLFELIVIISNQIIRQAQLVDILMETGYCKNRTAVTRLIQKLEENKLIHRFKEEHYRYTSIQALKPAIKFIKGVDAYPVKITHGIREITNAVRVELFKKYYLEDNMTLEQATFNAIQNPTSSLFSSNKNFYHWLNKDDLAFHSFNAKSSSFFKQIAEIDSISLQEKQKFQDSVRREEGAKLRTNKFDKRCWTLKTLTDRKTYLIQADLSEPFMEIKADWLDTYYKKAKNFEPTQLNLHFAIVTLASDPNKTNLVKSMMNVIKYVKRSFKMHFNYFIEEKEIKKDKMVV